MAYSVTRENVLHLRKGDMLWREKKPFPSASKLVEVQSEYDVVNECIWVAGVGIEGDEKYLVTGEPELTPLEDLLDMLHYYTDWEQAQTYKRIFMKRLPAMLIQELVDLIRAADITCMSDEDLRNRVTAIISYAKSITDLPSYHGEENQIKDSLMELRKMIGLPELQFPTGI